MPRVRAGSRMGERDGCDECVGCGERGEYDEFVGCGECPFIGILGCPGDILLR